MNVDVKSLRAELKGADLAIKKLSRAIASLDKAVGKRVEAREQRKQKLSEYATLGDLHEAFGWDYISEEEYYALKEAMEKGIEVIDAEISPEEYAQQKLRWLLGRLQQERTDIYFQLLPPEEQQRIIEEDIQRREKLEARRKAKEK